MDDSKKAALYIRVSTDGQSLDNQRPDLIQLAKTRGFEIVEVHEEKISAAAKQRPAFDKMMLAAHQGRWTTLVIWSLDRLGRSMINNLTTVLELDRIGVQVVSVKEQWLDTSGPVRSLLLAIFSWVAEQERRRISERTRAGIERARRAGKTIGRPRVTFDLTKALTLRAQRFSIRQVARQLKVGTSTVHRAFQAHDALAALVPKESPIAASASAENHASEMAA